MLEATNYVIYNQKIDKIANSMADFVTQGTTVSRNELDNFAAVASRDIMQPYTFRGTIVFSSVASYASLTPPCAVKTNCLNWQYRALGGLGDNSRIGSNTNGTATLPGAYTVTAGQNVIVAEVFDHYQPLLSVSANFLSAFNAQTIYKIAVFKPRLGTLTTLQRIIRRRGG
jgi:hypothetical protein